MSVARPHTLRTRNARKPRCSVELDLSPRLEERPAFAGLFCGPVACHRAPAGSIRGSNFPPWCALVRHQTPSRHRVGADRGPGQESSSTEVPNSGGRQPDRYRFARSSNSRSVSRSVARRPSMAGGTRSLRGSPHPVSRCGPSRSSSATPTPRRPRSTRTTRPARTRSRWSTRRSPRSSRLDRGLPRSGSDLVDRRGRRNIDGTQAGSQSVTPVLQFYP